jgi:3-oxoacyl-ACP reductase-like protein
MSDRLALSNAIEDAGIDRAKAERIASTIVDLIHDNVATKADVAGLRGDLKADVAGLRGDLKADVATVGANLRQTEIALKANIAAVDARLTLVEHRLMTRLGGLAVVLTGILFAALHYWPPHG